MAAAVRSAVTTVEAPPTPRKMSAGVIRAPPPIPVSPTIVPTKNAAKMIEKKSDVSQSPMGAILHRRLGKTLESTDSREIHQSGWPAVAQLFDDHLEQLLHGHGGPASGLGATPVGVGDVLVGRGGAPPALQGVEEGAPVERGVGRPGALDELPEREDLAEGPGPLLEQAGAVGGLGGEDDVRLVDHLARGGAAAEAVDLGAPPGERRLHRVADR